MPCTGPLRLIALTALIAVSSGLPAFGADSPAATAKGADRTHPEAGKINQANPRVIHAGPGAPINGAIFKPPAPGKKDRKN